MPNQSVIWKCKHENYEEDLKEEIGVAAASKLLLRNVEFYNEAIFRDLSLKLHDFVLVANTDYLDPELVDKADVAKILFMYENKEPGFKDDKYRAIVQWYTRPENLPPKIFNSQSFNEKGEVICDERYGNDISIETFFKHCTVDFVKKDIDSLKTKSSKRTSFICRYKLLGRTVKQFQLVSICPEPVTNTPSKRKTIGEDCNTPNTTKILLRRVSKDTTPNKRWKTDQWIAINASYKTPTKHLSPIKDVDDMEDDSFDFTDDFKSKRRITKSASKKSEFETPSKRLSQIHNGTARRRSILKTPNAKTLDGTPKKRVSMSNKLETKYEFDSENITPPKARRHTNYHEDDSDEQYTPRSRKSNKSAASPGGRQKQTPRAKSLLRDFSIGQRPTPVKTDERALQLARERLHVSAVPKTLPCRDKEFGDIYSFLEGKLLDNCGGCMYVSGVPGTGKTATTTEVIRSLQAAVKEDDLPDFDFIDINGMRLTEPRQAYVHIYRQLCGKTISSEHAYNLLDKRFNTISPKRKMTIMLVDELDILCNKRQDVVYNILNWPTLSSAKLVVVTIANTMDLPERLLMGKITSRLGLTRLTFQPYNFQQLQEIINARLSGTETFNKDAVQLVARKVAAVSGDARRALDICRRATEIAEAAHKTKNEIHVVSIADVQQALSEMIASAKIQAIKSCSKYEQMWLQSVCAEVSRTGVEECTFLGIYQQFESITAFNGIQTPNPGQALGICSRLGASRLLITEHSKQDLFMKVLLNISADDVHYALQPT